jgi:hypothetical protein
VKLRRGLSLERRQQQFRVRGWANPCCRCEYAMFRARGAVVMRPVPAVKERVVARVGAMQQLRRESVRTNLKAERPLGRRHEARGNQRANGNGYQQQADEPLTLNATEETVVHGLRPDYAREFTPPDLAAALGRFTHFVVSTTEIAVRDYRKLRLMNQYIPSPTSADDSTSTTIGRGNEIRARPSSATIPSNPNTSVSCPTSTPRLNPTSNSTSRSVGNRISSKSDANPNP